jgi:hypothetical protein
VDNGLASPPDARAARTAAAKDIGVVVFPFVLVEIFAADLAVEVVLTVGIELPDPLVVHVEPTEHGLARRWAGHRYLQVKSRTARIDGDALVATRMTRREPMVPPKPG